MTASHTTVDTPEATERLLRDLNDAQRAAVTHADGPLLIVAGASSSTG